MPGPYEGVHGFVFVYEKSDDPDDPEHPAPADVIEDLRQYLDPEVGPVFFAELFQGDFQGFAHFAKDDLEQLVDFAGGELFDAGIQSDYAAEGRVHVNRDGEKRGPKRRSPRFCAICRVKCRRGNRPTDVLDAIVTAFDDSEPFMGASRVIGRFQLLVEFGAGNRRALQRAVDQLVAIPSIARVKWAHADTNPAAGESDEPEDDG